MDDLRTCPGCGARGFEWVERDRCGWCLFCGFFEYYSSFSQFIEQAPDDDGDQS